LPLFPPSNNNLTTSPSSYRGLEIQRFLLLPLPFLRIISAFCMPPNSLSHSRVKQAEGGGIRRHNKLFETIASGGWWWRSTGSIANESGLDVILGMGIPLLLLFFSDTMRAVCLGLFGDDGLLVLNIVHVLTAFEYILLNWLVFREVR
jgi:hypothetical protein